MTLLEITKHCEISGPTFATDYDPCIFWLVVLGDVFEIEDVVRQVLCCCHSNGLAAPEPQCVYLLFLAIDCLSNDNLRLVEWIFGCFPIWRQRISPAYKM